VDSLARILLVGFVWAAVQALVLVLSIVIMGTSEVSTKASSSLVGPSTLLFTPYGFRPLPNFSIGWFAILIAFGSGFVLADIEQTIKALPLATFVSFISGLLFVALFGIQFPGVASQGYAEAAFFGFLAIPFFLLGLVGGILGCMIGAWAQAYVRGRPW
jgi:hypothetical protein